MAATVLPPPSIACDRLVGQWDRMAVEGVPDWIDKEFLAELAGGTQYLYRQTYRSLGLATDDYRPTQSLYDLVEADQADRPKLFGKIMQDRYPDLTGLALDATWDDFFGVLHDHYNVNTQAQQRKTLTFFVHAADYAGLEISPALGPVKRGPGSRAPRAIRQVGVPDSRPAKATTPAARADRSERQASSEGAGERRDISLGGAGSVSVVVNVRWLDLSEDQFTKLRKLIKDIEALGDSGS